MKRTKLLTMVIALSALVVCTVLFAQSGSPGLKEADNINSYSEYEIVESNSISGLVSKLNKLKGYKLSGGVVVAVERTVNNIEFKTYYQTIYK